MSFQPLKSANLGSMSLDNNGAGYNGKPSHDYYRFVPEHTCEGKEAPKAILKVFDTGADWIENRFNQCGLLTASLDLNLLDRSPFQTNVIGFKEGIFEHKATEPTAIPDETVEVWCRDGVNDNAIETITRFDRVQNKAMTQIYFQRNGAVSKPPAFSVARMVGPYQVELVNDTGTEVFHLVVHRDQPTAAQGLFTGDLIAAAAGVTESRSVSCRLGGTLDPVIWPAKMIADFNATQVQLSKNLKQLGFISSSQIGVPLLYAGLSNVQGQTLLTPPGAATQRGVRTYQFTPDSLNVVFDFDFNVASVNELYRSSVDGTNKTQLNLPLSLYLQSVKTDFKITADGSKLLYRDGSQDPDNDIEMSLFSAPLNGGPVTTVKNFNQSDQEVWSFDRSDIQDRTAFLGGNTYPRLYSSKTDGSDLRDISPPYSPPNLSPLSACTSWCFEWYSPVIIPSGANYALLPISDYTRWPWKKYTAAALDGSSWIDLDENSTFLKASPNANFLLFGHDVTGKQSVRSLTDLSQVDVSNFRNGFFSSLSSFYVGFQQSSPSQTQILALSLSSGQTSVLCPQAPGSAISATEFANGTQIALLFKESELLFKIYTSDFKNSCQQVASFPVQHSGLGTGSLVLSPDQNKALVHLSNSSGTNHELLYVPLNGRPPYSIALPVFSTGTVGQAWFLQNSLSVVFEGTQTEPGLNNVYLWYAPKEP